jgi:hypothetical protein
LFWFQKLFLIDCQSHYCFDTVTIQMPSITKSLRNKMFLFHNGSYQLCFCLFFVLVARSSLFNVLFPSRRLLTACQKLKLSWQTFLIRDSLNLKCFLQLLKMICSYQDFNQLKVIQGSINFLTQNFSLSFAVLKNYCFFLVCIKN